MDRRFSRDVGAIEDDDDDVSGCRALPCPAVSPTRGKQNISVTGDDSC